MDKIYRIKPSYVVIRKVPRDSLIHFVKRRIRDQVLDCHFKTKLKIGIIILKEIPIRSLKGKTFIILTDILKRNKNKRKIPFC